MMNFKLIKTKISIIKSSFRNKYLQFNQIIKNKILNTIKKKILTFKI
jgi:hypothetical protein